RRVIAAMAAVSPGSADAAQTVTRPCEARTHNHGAVLAILKPTPAPGFVVGDVPMPAPATGEVLLRVLAASVCGTDVHLYDWNPWAAARVRPPRVVGHEVAGAFATHLVVPEENVWPVGDAVPADVAAAMEPFGNAVHACSYGELLGRTVVVFGCGPIGCAAIAVARVLGAARVVGVDRNAYRLDLAERMGAHAVVRATDDAVDDAVRRAAGG